MGKQVDQGIFCISLDFELHWGTFETVRLDEKGRRRFSQTRAAIPRILDAFNRYNIQATWATVGMLFNRNATEWYESVPNIIPNYQHDAVSSYSWIKKNNFNKSSEHFYFAPDLVDLIASHDQMELATHTYSHYYCREAGQNTASFEADLKMAIHKALQRGISLKSLVFPRNQFNPEYLEVCQQLGIVNVRSNPESWFWDASRKESLTKKLVRGADHFLNIDQHTCVPVSSLDPKQMPMQIPASRFLRPWHPNRLINSLKLRRIKNEMTHAARNGSLYHLWWHPHNFGTNPDACLADLESLLKHFKSLQAQYGMLSLHMDGIRQYLEAKK